MSQRDEAFSLAGRVVAVTGAVGNLGAAVARTLHRLGARTVLIDRARPRLEAAFPELVAAREHLLIGDADLSDPQSVAATIRAAMDRFDCLDGLVHTVGGFRGGRPLHEDDADTWDFLFDINVRTTLNMCRAVAPVMLRRRSGAIVTVASRAAFGGSAGLGAYSASKAAVVRLTESLSADVRHAGVNVNCILPGTLDTLQNRAAMPDADFDTWVPPDDVARVAAFLLSPAGRAIHGAAIPVNGTA